MLVMLGSLAWASAAMASGITNGGDDLRTGWYPNAAISPGVVSGGTFGQLWSASVDGQVYAQPLVATTTSGSQTAETVIAATETNHVYGLDPANKGAQRWTRYLGTPWNPADVSCGDITPSIGTTATPVIDPTTNTVYLTHKTYVSGTTGPAAWYMDALDATTGQDRAGFPLLLSGTADNDSSESFYATDEQQRPGLLLMNGVVYAGFGSHCDAQPWEGWIFGVSTTTAKITARWVDNPNGDGAGIWQAGVGLMSDGSGTLLLTTGNGGSPSVAAPGSSPPQSFGDSVVRLKVGANGSLTPVDFFAPFDAQQLDAWDADFGSGGIVGLPNAYFGTSSIPHLAVAVGKEGYVYLLNRDNLGGYEQGSGGGDDVVQRLGPFGGVWGRPGVWPGDGGYVYIPTSSGESGGGQFDVYKYGVTGSGAPSLATAGKASDVFGWGSGSPVTTSDGTTSGSALVWIVWSADRTGANAQLRAYNPIPVNGTLQQVYRTSIGASTNYSTPGFGNDGRLYLGTRDGKVLAFGSPVAQPVSGSALTFPATTDGSSSSPQTLTLTANEPVTVSKIATSSAQFTAGSPSEALPAKLTKGQTISVPVTFSPSQTGPVAGQVTVTTDSGAVSVPLSGTGQSPSPQLAGSTPALSLGGAAVGSRLSGTVTFSNVGNGPLKIDSEHLPGAPFTATGAPALGDTIASGHSVTVEIDFAPTQVGAFSDNIELHSNVGGDVKIVLSARASTPGVLQASGEAVDFGAVPVGTTASRTFTLKNVGGTDVTVNKSKPPFGGAFTASTALPEGTTITPGETITETVAFTPTTAGPATAMWQITGDDGSGLHQVQFTGTGVTAAATSTTTTTTTTTTATPPPSGPVGPVAPVITHHSIPRPKAPKLVPAVTTTAKLSRASITYTALVVATSRFTLQREVTGRRGSRGCVPVTARNQHARRCTRFVTIATFKHLDRVGANRLRVTKMVPASRLRPGTYRLRSVLYDIRGVAHVFIVDLRIKPAR
jgi:hypothetical protein